jgi:hypothetical protein
VQLIAAQLARRFDVEDYLPVFCPEGAEREFGTGGASD